MDKLPLEILVKIAGYLPESVPDSQAGGRGGISRIRPVLASLSRKWQLAVEPLNFKSLFLKSTEIDKFASVFSASQPHRRSSLRYLELRIDLPPCSKADDVFTFESDQERLANNAAATAAVSALFNILASWGPDSANSILLSISLHSLSDTMDVQHDGNQPGRRRSPRHDYSYVSVPGSVKLPSLPCIWSLVLDDRERKFHPQTAAALMAHTPEVKYINWTYKGPGIYTALHRQLRNEFARSISTLTLPPSARSFTFSSSRSPPYRHHQRLPNLIHPHAHDPLCSALHHVLCRSNISWFSFTGALCPSLFWPYPPQNTGSQPPPSHFFPSLTYFKVEFSMDSPSGRWYFRGDPSDAEFHVPSSDIPLPPDTPEHFPPGYGSPDDTAAALAYAEEMERDANRWVDPANGTSDVRAEFRIVVDDEVMLPLLAAVARAAAEMPKLETFYLSTELARDRGEWFVTYGAPGVRCGYERYLDKEEGQEGKKVEPENRGLDAPRVFLHVEEWRPDDEVMGLLRRVSRKSWGVDAKVVFLPFLYR
ncbi:hypothetical protein VTK26DRAFT_749 [Humicola hyalothermophila]